MKAVELIASEVDVMSPREISKTSVFEYYVTQNYLGGDQDPFTPENFIEFWEDLSHREKINYLIKALKM